MPAISVNGRIFPDIQFIAFDKDGTLIDFHHFWSQRSYQWLDWLVLEGGKSVDNAPALNKSLCQSLGFDPQTNRIIPDSPLAVASMPKIYTIAAGILYQHGLSWYEAEQLVDTSLPFSMNAPPTAAEIQPIGNIQLTFKKLALNGIRIAIITSDDRVMTEATVALLAVEDAVDILVCGDDDIPNKPAPDALYAIGRKLAIRPAQMMMVGDTANDMIFGKNGKIGATIGIRGGAGNQADLFETADEVINSIEEIQVIDPALG